MIRKPKGTYDKLPEEARKWKYLENSFYELASRYGYEEIRTPTFEMTKLFKRGVGETTDIVKKEMFMVISEANMRKYNEGNYSLDEKGFTLRPEGTAPVVRSFVENKLYAGTMPSKLFYTATCFRNERPQAGRDREFTQFGVEALGSDDAFTDAEVISVANDLFQELGITEYELRINSVGCKECRPKYNQTLRDFFEPKLENLCGDCNERFEKNPLRIIDCKVDTCKEESKGFPIITDHLCDDCKTHHEDLKGYLDAMGISYVEDPKIVRGLDYYTKTAFEFVTDKIGSQSTICGGGRYNGLVEDIGGPATPGVGFGMGVGRLLMTLENSGIKIDTAVSHDVFVLNLGTATRMEAARLVSELRRAGISAELDHLDRSMKAKMRFADKAGYRFVAILGEDELSKGVVMLKDMIEGSQQEIAIIELKEKLEEIR